ncbi:hypothetical protein QLX08_005248 [Tetragonisca angustula]|uniref:Uncharacterized protein n=1 Tax=Tetragonisca angustula TaxID=166442 RepID=A0AAW0ZZ65_9HYME
MVVPKLVSGVLNFKIAPRQKTKNMTYLDFPLWLSYIIRQILRNRGFETDRNEILLRCTCYARDGLVVLVRTIPCNFSSCLVATIGRKYCDGDDFLRKMRWRITYRRSVPLTIVISKLAILKISPGPVKDLKVVPKVESSGITKH